jgi:hypothetical protein
MLMDIVVPSFFKLHCVLGPPRVLPNLSLVEDLLDHAKIDIWHLVPSLADELKLQQYWQSSQRRNSFVSLVVSSTYVGFKMDYEANLNRDFRSCQP